MKIRIKENINFKKNFVCFCAFIVGSVFANCKCCKDNEKVYPDVWKGWSIAVFFNLFVAAEP